MPKTTKETNSKKEKDLKSKTVSTSKKTVSKKVSKSSKTTTNSKSKKISKTTVSKNIASNKKSPSKKQTKAVSKSKQSKSINLLEYYDLPYRYNQTIVKILAQTPKTLFVYWDISDDDRKNYIKQYI